MEQPDINLEQQYRQEQLQALQNQYVEAKKSYQYDNEWIKFLNNIAENDSTKEISEFIKQCTWTDRQKEAIRTFTTVTLNRLLSTTFISGMTDYQSALLDFGLLKNRLVLGMTRFDKTPEYNQVIGMIETQFKLALRRSKGAYLIGRIGTQRTEFAVDEIKYNPQGFREKTLNRYAGGD